MKFNKIVAPTVKEMFIREVEKSILSGRLKPGDRLPTERELAEQMSISKTIVNSGLKELENRGFVEIRPRQSAVVVDFRRKGNMNTLLALIELNDGVFDPDTNRSFLALYRLLSVENASLAARFASEEDLVALREIYSSMAHCQEAAQLAQLEFDFQYTLACASANDIYPMLLVTLRPLYLLFAESLYPATGLYVDERYRQVIDAVAAKDPHRAAEIMGELADVSLD